MLKDKLPTERLALAGLAALAVAAITYAYVKGQRQPAPIVFQGLDGKARGASSLSSAGSGPRAATEAQGSEVVVHITGAVKKPSVLHLPIGARVDDAVKAAGGPTADADLLAINLAAKLIDGTQVLIPQKGKASPPGARAPGQSGTPRRLPKGEFKEKPLYTGPEEPVRISVVPEPYRGGSIAQPYVPKPASTTATESGQKADAGQPTKRRGKKEPPTEPVSLNSATAEQLETVPGIGPATAQKILDYRQEHGRFSTIDELTAVKGIGEKRLDAMRKYLKL